MTPRDLALAGAARFAVAEVARMLGNAGVITMPFKGALVQELVPGDVPLILSDVDLLVSPEDYHRGCESLAAEGFRVLGRYRDGKSATFAGPLPLTVDLHQRVHPRRLFRLDTAGLFRRGRLDRGLFGERVLRMDPRDVYAVELTHFVRSRFSEKDSRRVGRLVALEGLGLCPRVTAEHLLSVGAGRAAKWVLPMIPGAFARDVFRCLPPLNVGDRLALALQGPRPPESFGAIVASHALNETTPRAAASFVLHAGSAMFSRGRRPSSTPR